VTPGVVKIAVYIDGTLIPFLFHISRCQVSGVRNDEQKRWHLKPCMKLGLPKFLFRSNWVLAPSGGADT
jgi:hypothetical protein